MVDVANPQAEIGLLIYPDCQLAAIYGLSDLFRIANDQAQARLLASTDPLPPIRVSRWQVDEKRGDIACVDDSHPGRPHLLSYVIAPPSIVMPKRMRPMPIEAAWMNARHAEGSTLCSVCAGAFVLAETGLVDGRRATTHWAFADELGTRFPNIKLAAEHMIVDEGDIVTAGGILAWNDLGLILVERLMGPSVMLATARFLLVDPPRASQRPYSQFVPRLDHGDEVVRRAQHHLHAHTGEETSIAKLTGIAGLTERTFLRRFVKATGVKPIDYLQQTRITKAREMLELTNRPVDQIAWTVGYADPAAFRKVFQKLTGLAPSVFRQRFGVMIAPS